MQQVRILAPDTAWWRRMLSKEDWWAVIVGLGIVAAAYLAFASGSSLKWLAVTPAKWTDPAQLMTHFAAQWTRYLGQFVFWATILGASLRVMGRRPAEFLPSFVFVYVGAVIIFAIGAWDKAHEYQLEPPLVALLAGMVISNVIGLPRWMDSAFRVEYYVKLGIVLLGATLPFTLILWAGPIAILQASIVSVSTFAVIFWVGRKLGLDRRLCATLGVGGAVCGVSASIAIAGVVGAKREHPPIAITMVIIWAVIMIFALPFVARGLELHTAVAGAWIGAS